MSLLKYFKQTDDKGHSVLPNPQGSLSAVVPSSRIEKVNKLVQPIIDEQIDLGACSSSSRGRYEVFLPDEKAKIGKRAAEYVTGPEKTGLIYIKYTYSYYGAYLSFYTLYLSSVNFN